MCVREPRLGICLVKIVKAAIAIRSRMALVAMSEEDVLKLYQLAWGQRWAETDFIRTPKLTKKGFEVLDPWKLTDQEQISQVEALP